MVGDASATGTRSGEDTRRRGWFWHWNSLVTQYAPLIGLKGVGLLNSYTVWTDRREASPHRGYAFPSQQSEADFYGEDRAELIAINKILVALDLIEIRKEMVPRTDERGRRWKVPHNFYRVKDHDDDFSLTTRDVLKVVALAGEDRAVYRYVKRIFSPRFSPIDSQNVWHAILEEVRQDPTWQQLAAKTERDESKASARSRAGHAARRGEPATDAFFAANAGDSEESDSTAGDSDSDSPTVAIRQQETTGGTSVANTNTGSAITVDESNTGLVEKSRGSVDPANIGGPTSVEPGNRTYHQEFTTTTTTENADGFPIESVTPVNGPGAVPDTSRAEAMVIRQFEEANDRTSTPAERRLLRQLAESFHESAVQSGRDGWSWLGLAIDDAVAAGSRFVAPRRVREILARWERDGMPQEYGGNGDRPSRTAAAAVTSPSAVSHSGVGSASTGSRERSTSPDVEPLRAGEPETPFVAPVFTIPSCGMSSRQVWSSVLADIEFSGAIGRADVSTWLRSAAILAVDDEGGVVLGVPHDLALRRASGRYLGAIQTAIARVTGESLAVTVVLIRDWAA